MEPAKTHKYYSIFYRESRQRPSKWCLVQYGKNYSGRKEKWFRTEIEAYDYIKMI